MSDSGYNGPRLTQREAADPASTHQDDLLARVESIRPRQPTRTEREQRLEDVLEQIENESPGPLRDALVSLARGISLALRVGAYEPDERPTLRLVASEEGSR